MEITTTQLQAMLKDTEERGYARGRIDAAEEVATGAMLLTNSSRALEFLRKLALGRVPAEANI